jgi:2-oxoglutarate ferredoxin oxidoreductase subunit alpha
MDHLRYEKVAKIKVPDVEVQGDEADAQLLIVGFGSTYGHLYTAMQQLRERGYKVALAQLKYINPVPHNVYTVVMKYPKVVVAEQNLGQLAALLRIRVNNFAPYRYNQVKGQPFVVSELVTEFEKIINSDDKPQGYRDPKNNA